ncbi:restriction endonuclease subunit S [Alphaproteobacteria bacterium]|nr:restriction endonuclease subunit S [Alphaproteobacteria bacterium]
MKKIPSTSGKHFQYLPSDWKLDRLEKIVSQKITYGIVQPGKFDSSGIPLIRGVDYMSGWNNLNSFFRVSKNLHQRFKRSTTRKGDVLLSIAGYAGYVSVVPEWIEEANITQTTARISIEESSMSPHFVAYFLDSIEGKLQSRRYIKGSAQEGLNLDDVQKFFIPIPPLPEQKKITTILKSVDGVIENTHKQIDKLQDLKKATMNELLTKGIGHTEFKNSELGRIPKSWDVVSILDANIAIIDGDRGKEYPKEKDFKKSGYCLFLSAKNVTKNGFSFKETAFISKHKEEKLKKGRLSRKDLIITTRGTVGNIAQYGVEIPYEVVRINSGMAIIRNKDERLNSDFLYHILFSEIIIQQIKNLTFGSAQPQLTIGTLNELKLPIPQLSEQLKIVKIVNSIVSNIHHKKQKLAQTQSLKKSLMQDLLTGKVRVKVN